MIIPSGGVSVLVATKPVDFRKGLEGLAALVREAMGGDPFIGSVFVFGAKRADRVKLIFWDGTGMVLVAKRLEDGKCRWPGVQDAILRLNCRPCSKGSIGDVFMSRDRRWCRQRRVDSVGAKQSQAENVCDPLSW